MNRRHTYVRCDVFTDQPFTGNALAVFTDARGLSDAHMQAIAREMNLSETTFVLPSEDRAVADARVRIFTPRAELPFAGHPVLGTAFVLAAPLQREQVRLLTGRGPVAVRFSGPSGRSGFGRMQQPLPRPVAAPPAEALCGALGLPRAVAVAAFENGPAHALVIVKSPDVVAALRPDFGALAALWGGTCLVAAPLEPAPSRRWKARVFVPGAGVPEDPATGSAAGAFVAHLVLEALVPPGFEIEIEQGEEVSRPSRLWALARVAAGDVTAVEVGGDVVLVGRGEMAVR